MSAGQEVGQIFGEGSGPATALLRSPTVIIATISLWGMNILLFRLFGIDHVRILNGAKSLSLVTSSNNISAEDQAENGDPVSLEPMCHSKSPSAEITAFKCFLLSFLLLSLLITTEYVWIDMYGGDTIVAIFIFYALAVLGMGVSCESNLWIRAAVCTVFKRAKELINPRCSCIGRQPPTPVPFIDVFFADGMCSLSKVFFDWGMLLHLATHYPDPVPASTHSIFIPSALSAMPYLIRARQCLVMHSVGRLQKDPKRYQHALNAIKYSTSLFPICLSAYQKTVSSQQASSLEDVLVVLLIVNSLYSYAWDIIMDWGMMQNPQYVLGESCNQDITQGKKQLSCAQAFLRPRLRFGCMLSTLILVADGILRFSWVLRFYEKDLFPSVDAFILFTQFFEVFRRAIWNLLRVEWENIKQMQLCHKDDKEEQEPFVPSVQMVEQ